MFFKKSQAATEFLITYGWVILIALVALSALAYVGVRQTKVSNNICLLSSPFVCLDYSIVNDTVLVLITNAGAETLLDISPHIEGQSQSNCTSVSSMNIGEKQIIHCQISESTTKVKGSLIINYRSENSQFQHTASGDLVVSR